MQNLIDDEQLDRQFRNAAAYIDDDGFTSRVVESLPARPVASAPIRSVILITITALACVLAYLIAGRGGFVSNLVAQVNELPRLWLFVLALSVGLVTGVLGLAAALMKSREPVLITH
jgi:hypothetical protein